MGGEGREVGVVYLLDTNILLELLLDQEQADEPSACCAISLPHI